MDKPDWNMRQTVSIKIVAQLKEMTESEQRAFLARLLEHMEAPFIIALDFAYELTPGARRGSLGIPAFGRVLFEQGEYKEMLLADEAETQLILCVEGASVKLFRTEWKDATGHALNSAQYTITDAITAFREAVEMQREEKRGGKES